MRSMKVTLLIKINSIAFNFKRHGINFEEIIRIINKFINRSVIIESEMEMNRVHCKKIDKAQTPYSSILETKCDQKDDEKNELKHDLVRKLEVWSKNKVRNNEKICRRLTSSSVLKTVFDVDEYDVHK